MALVDLDQYCASPRGETHTASRFGETMGGIWGVCRGCNQIVYVYPFPGKWRTWTVMIEEEPY